MENNTLRIYTASGWFSENTDKSLTALENKLRSLDYVQAYFPRHDGVKLSANEFHDHSLRKKVFEDNVSHIEMADVLVVNLDGSDGFYDTGTCWELGYAMTQGTPIIAYDPTDTVVERFPGLCEGFYGICTNLDGLSETLSEIHSGCTSMSPLNHKLLFVGPDSSEEQIMNNEDIVSSVILESHGNNFRALTDLSRADIYDNIEKIFAGVDYMVAVIDDRHPVVSWMMGQAYARNIPIVSFTNYDYGVNIMLSISVMTHCKGKAELREAIQKIKREGIYSFEEYDTSALKAY